MAEAETHKKTTMASCSLALSSGAETLILPLACERILEASLEDAYQQHAALLRTATTSSTSTSTSTTSHTYWLIPLLLDILQEFPQILLQKTKQHQQQQRQPRLFLIHPREEPVSLLGALCSVLGGTTTSRTSHYCCPSYVQKWETLLRLLQTLDPEACHKKLTNSHKQPLHLACANPLLDSQMLRMILQVCYPTTSIMNKKMIPDVHGWTPLCHLLHNRPQDLISIRLLLQHEQQQKATTTTPTSSSYSSCCWTPMHAAVYAGVSVQVLNLLQTHFPDTVHAWASPHRKRGTDDAAGTAARGRSSTLACCTTPLHVACMMLGPRSTSQHQALLLLPSQRGNHRASNFQTTSETGAADITDSSSSFSSSSRIQIVQWLLQHPTVSTQVLCSDSWGMTPLAYAVQQGSLSVVQLLMQTLQTNHDHSATDDCPFLPPPLPRTGESILHVAVRNQHVDIVQWLCHSFPQLAAQPSLLSSSASPQERTHRGTTTSLLPIHVACAQRFQDETTTASIWSALLEAYPAALTQLTARGQSPRRIVACRIGWEGVARFDRVVRECETRRRTES